MEKGTLLDAMPKNSKPYSDKDSRLLTDEEFYYTRYWKNGSGFEYRKFELECHAKDYLKTNCPTLPERNAKEVSKRSVQWGGVIKGLKKLVREEK